MSDGDEVSRRLTAERTALAHFHVCSLELFGSTASGTPNAESDVDLLVTFDRPVDLFHFLELEEFLSGVLGRKVDLVPRESVKPALQGRIYAEARRVA
ncbi:MAG: nucleotidyltransferase family protein [Alphaproteobacteria bacterium]|nr:nucleotidyltransferase family protein [Alphaproteobacteria bacterium]MDP6517468.1 nucleotidyltransferase family protein [Alphaproteobacteria bacterium]